MTSRRTSSACRRSPRCASNVVFDGPAANEDFGLEQVTGNPADRYKFRTSPLRNVALQPTFGHNGAFVSLDAAIRHHLDVRASLEAYSTDVLDDDLRGALGPMQPLLDRLDSRIANPPVLSDEEFERSARLRAGRIARFAGEPGPAPPPDSAARAQRKACADLPIEDDDRRR